ncbi:hypothetical protein ElyMa_002630800 [Elysia marginata]|uniref:Reverse transcriptase domain-containing protein n=1 Tax=Elysia marginata TaxID=1093978 RepID=A0AAV4H8J5_9GAST|nr:hypothetical protein ElyMa_002630800 [Elysia marginata]
MELEICSDPAIYTRKQDDDNFNGVDGHDNDDDNDDDGDDKDDDDEDDDDDDNNDENDDDDDDDDDGDEDDDDEDDDDDYDDDKDDEHDVVFSFVWSTIKCEASTMFRPGRSTVAQILTLRRVMEGVKANKPLAIITFIGFKKAFDSIHRAKMWESITLYGCESWIMTDTMERSLSDTCTRMLWKALNIHWSSRNTNNELHGKLPGVDMKIAERRLFLAGYCYRHPELSTQKLLS